MSEKMLRQYKAARRVSTPLVAITTPDPAATMRSVIAATNGDSPALVWDIVRGLRPANKPGQAAYDKIVEPLIRQGADPTMTTVNLTETLGLLNGAPERTVAFILQAHRYINNEAVAQGLWNLRDAFKADQRTLVLLAPQITLPVELQQDVLVLDEELPDPAELAGIVAETHEAAGVKAPTEEQAERAVDALRGLAAFPAEQATAMSLGKNGLDLEQLWTRKRATIEATRGLGVDRERVTFDEIGGMEAVKEFGKRILAGGCRPRVVVRIDEIEKMLAGAGGSGPGDSSGVSQDALGVILREMEDQGWTGLIAVGPPGSGKSILSKALGGEGGIPTITLDLGAAKGSLVGESEQTIRTAMKVIKAIAGDGAFFVATCNKLDSLPPELRRRFRLGIWYFDLPTAEERESIWSVCLAKYRLPAGAARPSDDGWTGAEIRNCCDLAWRLGITPREAGTFVVPVAVSDQESVERLRRMANGKFLSASEAGVYRFTPSAASAPVPAGRRVQFTTES